MTGDELDTAYTALAEALGRAGTERSSRLLALLALQLILREDRLAEVLALIEQAERLTDS